MSPRRRLSALLARTAVAVSLVLSGCALIGQQTQPASTITVTAPAPSATVSAASASANASAHADGTTTVDGVVVPSEALQLGAAEKLHVTWAMSITADQILTITQIETRPAPTTSVSSGATSSTSSNQCEVGTASDGALTRTTVRHRTDISVSCVMRQTGPLAEWQQGDHLVVTVAGDEVTLTFTDEDVHHFTAVNYGLPAQAFRATIVATFPGRVLSHGTGRVHGTTVTWSPLRADDDTVEATGTLH